MILFRIDKLQDELSPLLKFWIVASLIDQGDMRAGYKGIPQGRRGYD